MSDYFRRFPVQKYRFGDNEPPALFQNIGAYVDLVDRVADASTDYEYHNILEYERPDVVSYKLYNNSNYGWTFFLLNEKLRIQGWPVSNFKIYNLSDIYYPNIVLTTTENIAKSQKVVEGSLVQAGVSGETGKVIKINYDLGQIVIQRKSFFPSGFNTIHDLNLGPSQFVIFRTQTTQKNAVNHYKDINGDRVDLYESHSEDESLLNFKSTTNLIPVTNLDRLVSANESLKNIKVFKSSSISRIVNEFNKLMLG